MTAQTTTVRLIRIPGKVLIPLPEALAHRLGLRAGTLARLVEVGQDLRVRPASAPKSQDHETEEEQLDRMRLEAEIEADAEECDPGYRELIAARHQFRVRGRR